MVNEVVNFKNKGPRVSRSGFIAVNAKQTKLFFKIEFMGGGDSESAVTNRTDSSFRYKKAILLLPSSSFAGGFIEWIK